MRKVAKKWLVEVDRRAWPSYLGAFAGREVSVSPELGEAFRRLDFPTAVPAAAITASGLTRFALAIEWEGDEGAFHTAFPDRPRRVLPLRRHDRFLAARLNFAGPEPLDLVVTGDTILAGEAVEALPKRNAPFDGPSRAGGKLAEALALLPLLGWDPESLRHWLELGAYPGGMTTELSRRGHQVTALDVRPPSAAMLALPGVRCVTSPAAEFIPDETFDALLCDVNGHPGKTAAAVVRLSGALRPGGLLIHTLKLPTWDAAGSLTTSVKERFAAAGLSTFALKHLRQNRQELTLFAAKEPHGHLRHR